eukprot:jgi/Tetstr1/464018/TSEL_008823.t1
MGRFWDPMLQIARRGSARIARSAARHDAFSDFETVVEFYRGISLQDESGNDLPNPFQGVTDRPGMVRVLLENPDARDCFFGSLSPNLKFQIYGTIWATTHQLWRLVQGFARGDLGCRTVCGYDVHALQRAAEGEGSEGICQRALTTRLLRAVGHMAMRGDAREFPTLVFTRPTEWEVVDALKNIHEGEEGHVDAMVRRLESLDASLSIDDDMLWSSVWNIYTTESPACHYSMAEFLVEDGGGSFDRWTGYCC